MDTKPLDLEVLRAAVAEQDAAFRTRTRLQPAAGPGGKVFPPTYDGRYAYEERRIDGENVKCVLLSSVAEQANHKEESLRRRWEENGLPIPMILVNFEGKGLAGLHRLTVLDVPHRLADALLRDSFLKGEDGKSTSFRFTAAGEALTLASNRDATDLFHWCPMALVFGVWDSTGPRGGSGISFPRALEAEIIGVNAVPGVKTSSRIDPAGIEIQAATLYEAADGPEKEPGGWVLEKEKAALKGGKPKKVAKKGKEGKEDGKPSIVLHGNIKPSIDQHTGGVTMDYALHQETLSLTALRRLRFPRAFGGSPFSTEQRAVAEVAAWTALAALGIGAITFAREGGYFLRSRCHLIPENADLVFERIGHNGAVRGRYTLDAEGAHRLITEARAMAARFGLTWHDEEVVLEPAEKLVTLIRKSQEAQNKTAEGK